MKKVLFLMCLTFSLFFLSAKPVPKEYNIGDEVELSGTVLSGLYLSYTEYSDMEYVNEALLLRLEEPIFIKDLGEEVTQLEIQDSFLFEEDIYLGDYHHRKVILKGKLGLVQSSANGYFRQIITPVYIDVNSLTETEK